MVIPLLLIFVTGLASLSLGVFYAVHRRAVPDAATPQLMAQVDDLPRRSPGACDRESERLPCRIPMPADVAGRCVLSTDEVADWLDLAARLESR